MHDTNVRCTEMIRSGAPVNPGTIYLSHPSRPCAAACPARQGRHQVVRRQDRAPETQQRQGNMNFTGTSLQHISKRKCRTPAVHAQCTRSAHAAHTRVHFCNPTVFIFCISSVPKSPRCPRRPCCPSSPSPATCSRRLWSSSPPMLECSCRLWRSSPSTP